MQESHVTASKLFVSGGNTPKMFDPCEETFNQIAVLVQMRIVGPEFLAVGARRDDRLGATGLDTLDQGIGVVALLSAMTAPARMSAIKSAARSISAI
jgi:hypothetical protein